MTYFEQEKRFNLKPKDREFVLQTLPKYPRELGFEYQEFPDGYVKFFIYGDTKKPIKDSIKIYNKVGDAYGTLTDNAYIAESEDTIEFFLTATVLVNKNGIFNDDTYEYESLGIPFLAELGREILRLEKQQKP